MGKLGKVKNGVIDIEECKQIVADYFNQKNTETPITKEEVYMVWFSKTLEHGKGLFGTNHPDGMYYEITYNGKMDEYYFDAYSKEANIKITKGDVQ